MRTLARHRRRTSGFTLIEILVGVALLGVILANVYLVLSDARANYQRQTISKDVELLGQRAIDRIATSLMGAVRDQMYSQVQAPGFVDSINYATVLGYEHGERVFSPPQRIELETAGASRSVTWTKNPGQEDATSVVWTKDLSQYCAGEVPNGKDDNGNGLVDEKGLAFAIEGNMVRVTLTIEKLDPDGVVVTKKLETKVTCRN